MKILAAVQFCVLAAAGHLPAQPGTDAEALDYARREAESPEAQAFLGGDISTISTVSLAIFLIILFVALFISNVEGGKGGK